MKALLPKKSLLWHAANGTLTRQDRRNLAVKWERHTRTATILKPSGWLGAPWIDSFVALGKSVALCEECYRRYGNWWERYSYRGLWGDKHLTDCDGCGKSLHFCTLFYPASTRSERFANIPNA